MPSQALLTTALPHSPPRPRHGSALPPAAFSLELAPRLTPHHWSPAHTGPGGILYGLAAPQMATFVLHAQAGGGYTPGAEKPGRTDGPRPSTSTLAPSSGPGPAGRPLASHASLPPLRSRGASRPPPTLRLASRSPGQTPSRLLLLRGDPPASYHRAHVRTHTCMHTRTRSTCAHSPAPSAHSTRIHTLVAHAHGLSHTRSSCTDFLPHAWRVHTLIRTQHMHTWSPCIHLLNHNHARTCARTHTLIHAARAHPHPQCTLTPGTCTPSPTAHAHALTACAHAHCHALSFSPPLQALKSHFLKQVRPRRSAPRPLSLHPGTCFSLLSQGFPSPETVFTLTHCPSTPAAPQGPPSGSRPRPQVLSGAWRAANAQRQMLSE